MVKFDELLGKAELVKSINPIEIFNKLDKDIDKGFLRPPQKSVLEEWFKNFTTKKDVIVKLHTGQGKTLIGLLLLQSSLNEETGPALYVCPNNYLVNQIITEARSFGIKAIKFGDIDRQIPQAFLNSEAILVCNCKKLFNGKSVFGVKGVKGKEAIGLGAIVIDDAHKCLDLIRESFSIIADRQKEGKTNPIYGELWQLFEGTLSRQAPGTCIDIKNEEEGIMAVPFWTWYDKRDEVLQLLSKYKDSEEVRFVWNLIKDHLTECVCIFSENRVEIAPRLLPIDCITSYAGAKRRILLSATLNDDAFLIKDMGIPPESVMKPISSGDVPYSGERLIILPLLLDANLDRETMINWTDGIAKKHGSFGVVAITPSTYRSKNWKAAGGKITSGAELYKDIETLKVELKDNKAKTVLVMVNQYDGIDLPAATCRILVLDSLPSYVTLMDNYLHTIRPFSGTIRRQLAQRVEQGMGRALRGYTDWCIVMIIGADITRFLSDKTKRAYLSNEAQLQIAIGEQLIAKMKEEGRKLISINTLVTQCLNRDEGWRQFYRSQMEKLQSETTTHQNLERIIAERDAELLYRQGQFTRAPEILQRVFPSADPDDKAWLLQLMATYIYPVNVKEAMNKQVKAYSENQNLFRPEQGITYSKIVSTGTRSTRILSWLKLQGSYNAAIIEVKSIIDKLLWGTAPSHSFEQGILELGIILGFVSDRPEKVDLRGPDNLWNIRSGLYWLIECKSQVKAERKTISKEEIGQLSNSIAWFKEYYGDEQCIPIIVHPAKEMNRDAFIKDPFWIMTMENLNRLKENSVRFYNALTEIPFDTLTAETVTQKLGGNELETEGLQKKYLTRGNKKGKS